MAPTRRKPLRKSLTSFTGIFTGQGNGLSPVRLSGSVEVSGGVPPDDIEEGSNLLGVLVKQCVKATCLETK